MIRITRPAGLAYALALVTLALDQASKAWMLLGLGLVPGASIPVAAPIFRLTQVWNTGFSFGLLREAGSWGRWLLTGFSTLVVVAFALWARTIEKPLTAWALGLIMGGAIGNNLIDRVRFGAVYDFLDFSGAGFPWVFNLADAAINVGVVLLLLDMLRGDKRT